MPKEKKPRTVDIARQIAGPIAERQGIALWDVRFEKEGVNWYLRFFIDKPGGVNIVDCENFSRAIDGPLDEADPIEQSYILEVSSPGIERALTRPEHFEPYVGSRVHVRLIRPRENTRDLIGELIGRTEDSAVILRLPGEEDTVTIPWAEIAGVKLAPDTDFGGRP
ncbi:MAG: ribosome maturation factor RimP [Oscillospiraceae bacterium]|nr:ribosome maturation factor RimP [Oscillospiraceae bacterium]